MQWRKDDARGERRMHGRKEEVMGGQMMQGEDG